MLDLKDEKIEWYRNHPEEYEELRESLKDFWDNTRASETRSIDSLDSHIWTANTAAATLLIGYLQTQPQASYWQIAAAIIFVFGILFMFSTKFVAKRNSSVELHSFRNIHRQFMLGKVTANEFNNIYDKTFMHYVLAYKWLRISAGIGFILGLVLLLVSIWPKS